MGNNMSTSLLWRHLQKRPVVHVDVSRNPITNDPKTHIATYSFPGSPPIPPFSFTPTSFNYSKDIVKDVKRNLPPGHRIDENRLQVKVWRSRGALSSPRREKFVVAGLLLLLLLEVAALTGVAIWFNWTVKDEDSSSAAIATLLLSVAVNGATAAGILFARASPSGQPFETGKTWVWRTLFPILLLLIINLFVLTVYLGWMDLLPIQFEWLKHKVEGIQIVLGTVVVIWTVLAAAGSGAIAMARWTAVEEIQRRFPAVRSVVDDIQRREVVKAPPAPPLPSTTPMP
ncbi:hypothetical protein [Arthrobacter sp. Z1-15]